MVVDVSTASASDGVASFLNYSNNAGCSMEQIFTPLSINKTLGPNDVTPGFRPNFPENNSKGPFGKESQSGPTQINPNQPAFGGIGPTIRELNPYFPNIFGDDGTAFIQGNDYNVVVHEDESGNVVPQDLNIRKNPARQTIKTVRTQGFRAPMILSGWGFGIDDMPMPNSVNAGGGPETFNP